jgi:hypothetical protein
MRLLELAERWSSASLPADPFGGIRRTVVLRAIAAHIAGVICGDRWQGLERRFLSGSEPAMNEFREAIGAERYQRELALDLSHQVERFEAIDLDKRAMKLAFALQMHARRAGVRAEEDRFAEFLLRLASEPATLLAWPQEELREALNRAIASPVLVRAARYVVLAVNQCAKAETGEVVYAGWVWQ